MRAAERLASLITERAHIETVADRFPRPGVIARLSQLHRLIPAAKKALRAEESYAEYIAARIRERDALLESLWSGRLDPEVETFLLRRVERVRVEMLAGLAALDAEFDPGVLPRLAADELRERRFMRGQASPLRLARGGAA